MDHVWFTFIMTARGCRDDVFCGCPILCHYALKVSVLRAVGLSRDRRGDHCRVKETWGRDGEEKEGRKGRKGNERKG